MDNKAWLWVGGAVVLVLVLYMARGSGSGAQVIPGADTSAETSARFSFAAAGLDSLSKLASDALGYESAKETALGVAQSQVQIEQARDSALTAAANSYADAQKYSANQQQKASSNSSAWGAAGSIVTAIASVLAAVL